MNELSAHGTNTISSLETIMATESGVSLKPPKPLIITEQGMANSWKSFSQQFEWYSVATNLMKKSPEIQVATFMTALVQTQLT